MYYLKPDYKIKKYNVKTFVIIIIICCKRITIFDKFVTGKISEKPTVD